MKNVRSTVCFSILVAALVSGCSQTATCRPETVIVKATCGASLAGATMRVSLKSPSGMTSEVLSLGPCPASQSAEFALPNYNELASVSVFVEATKDSKTVATYTNEVLPIAAGCTAVVLNLDDYVVAAGADSGLAPVTDSDAGLPLTCPKGQNGCPCQSGNLCSATLVCVDSVCRSGKCGDGSVDEGERCDDGNASDSDGCLNTCQPAKCSDGVVEKDKEECDDGNSLNIDSCTSFCKVPKCGDGFVQAGEICDDGATDNAGPCLMNCSKARCGDTFVRKGVETCDDGNMVDNDACTNSCKSASCGDGKPQSGEACDDGNSMNTDNCLNDCSVAKCGDGFVLPGVEVCDDGNQNNADGCTNSCKVAACGDNIVQSAEECDDGNGVNTDGCASCKNAKCGDGHVQSLEECDDGNGSNSDSCTSGCKNPRCGDGFTQPGEACDDGASQRIELDACTPDCKGRYEKKFIKPTTSLFGGDVSPGLFNGNLEGPAGADKICQRLFGPTRALSKWKALIVGGGRRAAVSPFSSEGSVDWVLRKHTYYYNFKNELLWRTDQTALLGVRNGASSTLLADAITDGYPWSGWSTDWTTKADGDGQGTCRGWTANSFDLWGTFALRDLTEGRADPCSYPEPLLCVEQ